MSQLRSRLNSFNLTKGAIYDVIKERGNHVIITTDKGLKVEMPKANFEANLELPRGVALSELLGKVESSLILHRNKVRKLVELVREIKSLQYEEDGEKPRPRRAECCGLCSRGEYSPSCGVGYTYCLDLNDRVDITYVCDNFER